MTRAGERRPRFAPRAPIDARFDGVEHDIALLKDASLETRESSPETAGAPFSSTFPPD